MQYHIDTGLIYEKFKENGECPLCEIEKKAQEQFVHEFLNDAVMEDDSRISVAKHGFCEKHFDALFSGKNKLSVALQVLSRCDAIEDLVAPVKSAGKAKTRAAEILKAKDDCVICDLLNKSMEKYYKTIAQMFVKEREFFKLLYSSKGFCMKHYAELLRFSSHAFPMQKEYLKTLSEVQKKNFDKIKTDLKAFCDSHDYRNAYKPLGESETALPRIRTRLYGKKPE